MIIVNKLSLPQTLKLCRPTSRWILWDWIYPETTSSGWDQRSL